MLFSIRLPRFGVGERRTGAASAARMTHAQALQRIRGFNIRQASDAADVATFITLDVSPPADAQNVNLIVEALQNHFKKQIDAVPDIRIENGGSILLVVPGKEADHEVDDAYCDEIVKVLEALTNEESPTKRVALRAIDARSEKLRSTRRENGTTAEAPSMTARWNRMWFNAPVEPLLELWRRRHEKALRDINGIESVRAAQEGTTILLATNPHSKPNHIEIVAKALRSYLRKHAAHAQVRIQGHGNQVSISIDEYDDRLVRVLNDMIEKNHPESAPRYTTQKDLSILARLRGVPLMQEPTPSNPAWE